MSKTLEQTIHEAELPAPAPGGEDFSSYIARVAHAAAFIGAAWAIANGPQVQGPEPEVVPQGTFGAPTDGYTVVDQDEPHADGPADPFFVPEPGDIMGHGFAVPTLADESEDNPDYGDQG